jgi:hypothetical protein
MNGAALEMLIESTALTEHGLFSTHSALAATLSREAAARIVSP